MQKAFVKLKKYYGLKLSRLEDKKYYDNVCDSCESKIHEQLINELTKDNK